MQTLSNIFLILLSFFFVSCDDIFEEDIEDDTLTVIAPLEGTVIESNVTNFRWEELEGATKYRIEIYDHTDDKIVDTLVQNKLNLVYPLNQGQYKWKARAENAAYESKYSVLNSFTVVESLDLTNQQVLLVSPSESYYTNELTLNCIWRDLPAAENYDFELLNITNGQTVIQQAGYTSTTFPLSNTNISSEAKYIWKVKAKNTTSETLFSSRTFFIDRTLPVIANLISPNNNSIHFRDENITFNWSSSTDTGTIQSPISYIFEVSNSTSFSNLVYTTTITTNSFQKSFANSGDYYWRVKAIDSARNTSGFSLPFKFTIN